MCFEVYEMQRKGFCRGCDKPLDKGDTCFYTYSIRNRGQNIYVCFDCLNDMRIKHDEMESEHHRD